MKFKTALNPLEKNLLILHGTVFIWGFTGILGALISVSAFYLVWYRLLIASLSLLLYLVFAKVKFKVDWKTFLQLACTGALVGMHWLLFFQSIKISTVSVTLVCLSSITLFTAVFEPLVTNKKISRLEILAGLMIIFGIFLIFKFESQYTKGIILGLISAAAASIFSIINSQLVKQKPAPVIAFYELTGAFFWLSVYLFFMGGFKASLRLSSNDFAYLILLGTVCTSVAYVAGVAVMRQLSAFRVALVTNLEPVYGIIMAFIFFGDLKKMTPGFWIGAVLILSTIFLFPVAQQKLTNYRLKKQNT
ncbi:DMT family transporter [uncultured Mucilaginibacter sp.]|uniref:DMT family transporter n=1 Tax=uncultured Mucilaginibacter sp. TaxID=797541 RepID=UPI00261BEBC7|nr:DMT family transporter [uncultured Mucilaginibacter sp.]